MSDPNEDAAWELQKAMVAAAIADAGLKTLMGDPVPAFDFVPERQAMPYLQFDEPSTEEWDVTPTEASNGYGKQHSAMIHVWSAYEGRKELNLILRRLELIYRNFSPTLTGHRLANIRLQFVDRLRDPDGQALHGVIQFRAVTEEI